MSASCKIRYCPGSDGFHWRSFQIKTQLDSIHLKRSQTRWNNLLSSSKQPPPPAPPALLSALVSGVKGKAGFSFILSCVRTRLCQLIAQYPIWPLQGAHLCSPARSVHACLFYFFTQVKAHAVRLHYSSSAAAFSQRPSLSTHTHADSP